MEHETPNVLKLFENDKFALCLIFTVLEVGLRLPDLYLGGSSKTVVSNTQELVIRSALPIICVNIVLVYLSNKTSWE